jgi:hypothetical protein
MKDELKMLWKTYDFILNKIVSLEDELSYLISPEQEGLRLQGKKLKKVCGELTSSYDKQLLTIRELKVFYKKNPADIKDGRRSSIEAFTELEEVTIELRDAIAERESYL